MTRFRAVLAALLLLTIVVGVPIALWLWGVSPLAVADLVRPDDGSAVLAALTVVGWLAWLAFALSVVVEAINFIGHRTLPLRIPLLGGVQSIAGALVVTALSTTAGPAMAASAAPAVSPASAAASASLPSPAVSSAADDVDEAGSYQVRPGDDLWSVAEQLLGHGSRWRLLAEANPGLLANPTIDLPARAWLVIPELPSEPGVAVPATRPHPTPAKPQRDRTASPLRVVVQRGDTLSALAEEHLGAAAKWPRIFRANKERIKDPDLIDVGWQLVIPARSAAVPKPARDRPVRKQPHLPQADSPLPEAQQSAESQPPGPEPRPTPGEASQAPGAAASGPGWSLVGGISGAAAAMILAGLGLHRLDQLRARPLGRRINHPPVDIRRYETALGRREQPDTTALLETALRALGRHAHAVGKPLPRLTLVRVDRAGVSFEWAAEPGFGPPEGFRQGAGSWRLTSAAAAKLGVSAHPVPFPALVTLGRDADGCWLMIDLESRSPLALDGPRSLRHAAAAAMAVELSCSPWASELGLIVVGGDEMFVRAACPELVRFCAETDDAMDTLRELIAARDADDSATVLLRVDPERAEAGAAQIVIVADEPNAAARARLDDLLGDPDLGVAGVVAGQGSSALVLSGTDEDPRARLDPEQREFRPHLIPAHTRAAIGTIFAATDEPPGQAPWWSEADNVRTLVPRRESVRVGEPRPEVIEHPYLKLIGPIELLGAAGDPPARSRRQCEEYCAWLLENPRSTATRMATELVVAESTRRSNMSRLRSWLGSDATGAAYLPEAYSGRIQLHPGVESDWQRVQLLTAPGLNRLAPEALVSVLEYVRGAPLADAAPGQWRWAEELRTDMASLIRDAGVLLTRWALEHQDLDVARWAAARALLVAPEDELLLVERINTEVLAGNTDEVRRLVRWVTGQARALGVDLAPETVDACQRAMEGRTRPRAAR